MNALRIVINTRLGAFDPVPQPLLIKGKLFEFHVQPNVNVATETHRGLESAPIYVHAASEKVAERAIRLLTASFAVVDAHVEIGRDYYNFLPSLLSANEGWFDPSATFSRTAMLPALFIAARASFRKVLSRAVYKYDLACRVHSNNPYQIDPAGMYIPVSAAFEDDRVRYAYSILLFYSVVEELGLEIRASSAQPSKSHDGSWNPHVLLDLRERLSNARIDPDQLVPWNIRGLRSSIQKAKPIPSEGKAPWAFGQIRDKLVRIEEGLAQVSWIRSKVSAHRIKEPFRSLSVYDVENANMVARFLLLQCLRLFDCFPMVGERF